MTGILIREKWITREMVAQNPDNIYVFGDNMERIGMGGQAAAMRGFANAIGIPTKWSPGMNDEDFFSDEDLGEVLVCVRINAAFQEIEDLICAGYDIVIPEDGLGTGLSQLARRAPRILEYIEEFILGLSEFGDD
jgi:hypothetical protein